MEIYPDKLIIQEKYTTLLRILIWNNIHEPNLACNVMSLVGYTIYNQNTFDKPSRMSFIIYQCVTIKTTQIEHIENKSCQK